MPHIESVSLEKFQASAQDKYKSGFKTGKPGLFVTIFKDDANN